LVWGTTIYTDDSDVGAAAVHANKIAIGQVKSVTVLCSGSQISFTGSTVNGIASRSYGQWGKSFTFDLGGITPNPSPPAPDRCFAEPCALSKCRVQGSSFDVVVSGAAQGGVWGSDVFTDDSAVGVAAVFLGLGSSGETISVTVTCTGSQSSYTGATQNGVTTLPYGFWGYSYRLRASSHTAPPPPPATVCNGACLQGTCTDGTSFILNVAGTTFGYGWGSTRYTDDSTVGLVAVHSGVLLPGETSTVLVTCTGPQSSFTGTTAHQVSTSSYGPFGGSFTLSIPPTPNFTPCAGLCAHNRCTVPGKVMYFTLTGSTTGHLWGTSIYSDDSDPATALVHAGLAASGETKSVKITCTGPQETFEGTSNAGVTSSGYGYWPFSYTMEAL
jgi:hypothetical protein